MELNNFTQKEQVLLEWYGLHSDSILKYIAIMIKDFHKAEDLTHETFIKAFKHMEEVDNPNNPKAWLFRIARNVTIDYIRRQSRYMLLLHLLPKQEKDSVKLTEHIIIKKESSEELYNILCKLKESYREVIILRKIKEFSIMETCQILGWSESKVKNTLSRALKALEMELKKEGIFSEQF